MLDRVDGWNVICWARDISCGVGVGAVTVVSVVGAVGVLGVGVLYCRSKPALRRILASIFSFGVIIAHLSGQMLAGRFESMRFTLVIRPSSHLCPFGTRASSTAAGSKN